MDLRVFVISFTAVWFYYLAKVYGNDEVDVLVALRHQFEDPSDVLEDWHALNNSMTQVYALYDLREQFDDPSDVLRDWDMHQLTPCFWSRVICDTEDRVTRIDLGNANLSGQLVPQLGRLTSLQHLELYSNNITGTIPDELGKLTNLVSLKLFDNRLDGVIPDTLGNLQKLSFLELFNNRLDGVIPDTLGNLQKLRFLLLKNNRLTGTIPISLTTILSLQVLDFSNNNLSGEVPRNGSFSIFGAISFVGNPDLKVDDDVSPQPPTPPSSQSPTVGNSAIWAIARGVAALLFAGAALL